MKRVISKIGQFIALCGVIFGVGACKCSGPSESSNVENIVVEETVKENKVWMEENFGDNYMWFETYVTYTQFLDEEFDGIYDTITSVFQAAENADSEEVSYDTKVIFFVIDNGILQRPDIQEGFWVGDCVMSEEDIELTFTDALHSLMKSNYPKPHSKNCVLRQELGPAICNPQYIFGNVQAQIYVDAKTGEVSDENPAYKGYDKVSTLAGHIETKE